jgi:hypothetical protein
MLYPGQPGHCTLDTQSKTRVRDRPIPPQIQIPSVVGFFQSVFGNAVLEYFEALLPLATTNDLAISVGRN